MSNVNAKKKKKKKKVSQKKHLKRARMKSAEVCRKNDGSDDDFGEEDARKDVAAAKAQKRSRVDNFPDRDPKEGNYAKRGKKAKNDTDRHAPQFVNYDTPGKAFILDLQNAMDALTQMAEAHDFDFPEGLDSKQKEVVNRFFTSASQFLKAFAEMPDSLRELLATSPTGVTTRSACTTTRHRVLVFSPKLSNAVKGNQDGLEFSMENWAYIFRLACFSLEKVKDSGVPVDEGLINRLRKAARDEELLKALKTAGMSAHSILEEHKLLHVFDSSVDIVRVPMSEEELEQQLEEKERLAKAVVTSRLKHVETENECSKKKAEEPAVVGATTRSVAKEVAASAAAAVENAEFVARFQKQLFSAEENLEISCKCLSLIFGWMVHSASLETSRTATTEGSFVRNMFDEYGRAVMKAGVRCGGEKFGYYKDQRDAPKSLLGELWHLIRLMKEKLDDLWEGLNDFSSDKDLMVHKEGQENSVQYAKKRLADSKKLDESVQTLRAFSNLYFSAGASTTMHTDYNKIALQAYFGNFSGRRLILPTLCIAMELHGGDVVLMDSNRIPHCSTLKHEGESFMFAFYNSSIGDRGALKGESEKKKTKK